MSSSTRHVAIVLALALASLVVSPAWHHDHPVAWAAGSHQTQARPFAGSISERHPTASCPICFSQRLLSQTSLEVPQYAEAPSVATVRSTTSSVVPSAGRSLHVESRAPPAC